MTNKQKTYESLHERLEGLNPSSQAITQVEASDIFSTNMYSNHFWKVMQGVMPKNSLKEGFDGEGGVLVPDEFEKILIEALQEKNLLRRIGNVISQKHDLKVPTVSEKGQATWQEESESIADSDDTFSQLSFSAYKIGSTTLVSDELLEDSGFDLEEYIANSLMDRIASLEEASFFMGDGVKKPLGLVHTAQVGAISENVGMLGMDDAIDLFFSVNAEYRKNAVWVMSDDAYRILIQTKTGFGLNLWQPAIAEESPTMLLGKSVFVSDALPLVAPGTIPVLFGDFSHFVIADRGKQSIKRFGELYAQTGMVGFQLTQRVDAKLLQPEAIKVLKIKS